MGTCRYRLHTEVKVPTPPRTGGPRWCKKCRHRTEVCNHRTEVCNLLVPWGVVIATQLCNNQVCSNHDYKKYRCISTVATIRHWLAIGSISCWALFTDTVAESRHTRCCTVPGTYMAQTITSVFSSNLCGNKQPLKSIRLCHDKTNKVTKLTKQQQPDFIFPILRPAVCSSLAGQPLHAGRKGLVSCQYTTCSVPHEIVRSNQICTHKF